MNLLAAIIATLALFIGAILLTGVGPLPNEGFRNMSVTIEGKDNNGRPRQEFADKLAAMSDNEFLDRAEKKIWLSAYANNNPRSDAHWQADACYSEARRRGKPELYQKAWEKAAGKS